MKYLLKNELIDTCLLKKLLQRLDAYIRSKYQDQINFNVKQYKNSNEKIRLVIIYV